MNAKYLNRLNKLADSKTLQRKVDYIKYNLGHYISEIKTSKLSVLEIGPGLGELVHYLNSHKIINIDIADNDKGVLQYLNGKYKINKSILLNNIEKQEKSLRNYDFIVLIQVLEHIPLSLQVKIIKILYSHLNKGGKIAIVVPNASNPLGVVERYADYQHTSAFTQQSLQDLVNLAKLESAAMEIKGYQIPPYGVVNVVRIFLQKILHLILLGILMINGGVFFKIMTPNIMLVITKK